MVILDNQKLLHIMPIEDSVLFFTQKERIIFNIIHVIPPSDINLSNKEVKHIISRLFTAIQDKNISKQQAKELLYTSSTFRHWLKKTKLLKQFMKMIV